MEQETMALGDVTDRDLIARLHRLVRADRTLSARMLVHLGEMDARGLYRECACASMFAYCVQELHMSEAEAYLRIQAARLGRQFPLILQLVAENSLHLTAIKLLAPHLTPDNHARVLEQARGKNKREIELLVAALAPKPDVPSKMRKLPVPNPMPVPAIPAAPAPLAPQEPDAASAAARTFALEAPRPAASLTPLRPSRYRLELTAGQALHDKLEQLRNLLRHQIPDGDLATIVELAVDQLVEKTLKQRFAQKHKPTPKKRVSVKPRARRRKLNSRYIPRAVVREVHERDSGQCTYESSDGKRCCERGFLELHHSVPFAKGGEATAENMKLLCRAHNALHAERDFGAAFIRSKRSGPSSQAPANQLEARSGTSAQV